MIINSIRMKLIAVTITIFTVLTSSFFTGIDVGKTPIKKGVDSITVQKAREHVEFLSDDKLEGRKVGSTGTMKAADYIASCLKDMGVTSYGESFFQDFERKKIEEFCAGSKIFYRIPDDLLFLRNVLGKIEGKNKDEYVIVGAHYDHIGLSRDSLSDDRIYNGADDNASGVSAVLQIAKAFIATGEIPQKTIIFAFWDAEEIGLVGSKCFVASFEDISKVKSYLNLDMIGRNYIDTCYHVAFIYSDTTCNYGQLVKDNIQEYGLNLESVTDDDTINSVFSNDLKISIKINGSSFKLSSLFRNGSDNASFEAKGVPIFLFTTGIHTDYHKVSDHAENINWEKLNEICKLSFITSYKLANGVFKEE